VGSKPNLAELQRQATDAERGFAKSMADRNFAAFQSYLSDEAVFFTRTSALRGKQAVADFWKRFYEKAGSAVLMGAAAGRGARFGTLANQLRTGPRSERQARRQLFVDLAPRSARSVEVIFDRGNDECDCPKPQ
jgi:hypothetical protein